MKDLHLYPIVYHLVTLKFDDVEDIENELDYLLGHYKAKNIEVLEHKLKKQFKGDIKYLSDTLFGYITENDIIDIETEYCSLKLEGSVIEFDYTVKLTSMRNGVSEIYLSTTLQYYEFYNDLTSNGNKTWLDYRLSNDIQRYYYDELQALSELVCSFVVYASNGRQVEDPEIVYTALSDAESAFETLHHVRREYISKIRNVPEHGFLYAIVKGYYWYWQYHITNNTPRQYMYKNFSRYAMKFHEEKDYQLIIKGGEAFAIEDTASKAQIISNNDPQKLFKGNKQQMKVDLTPGRAPADRDIQFNDGGARDKKAIYNSILSSWLRYFND